MDTVRDLEELLGDYPKIWYFYKQDFGDKGRSEKYAQRYPLPINTLSLILDFHKWTHATARIVNEHTGLPIPRNARPSQAGPCPLVISRLHWLMNCWNTVEANKSLAKTLGDEVVKWQTRIKSRVNDGDVYSYTAAVICQRCHSRTIMRVNDRYLCVNADCRDRFTGEWFSWEIA